MKNLIFVIFILFQSISYSQSIESDSVLNVLDLFNNPDTLYNPAELKTYFSDRDTIQYYTEVDSNVNMDFIDTLKATKLSILEYEQQHIIIQNELVRFFNKEKLLVVSSEKSFNQYNIFMTFEREERYGVSLQKYFKGENEEIIVLSYIVVGDKRLLNWVSIRNSTYTTIKTYFIEKKKIKNFGNKKPSCIFEL
jgi:hypothetical protein